MQNLDIVKMLTVSMNHITEETAEALHLEGIHNKMQLSVYVKSTANNGPDYGLYIDIDLKRTDWDDIPEDLMPLIQLAIDNGCEVLCLDVDGQELEDYTLYE